MKTLLRIACLVLLLSVTACRSRQAGPTDCPNLGIGRRSGGSGQDKPHGHRHLFHRQSSGAVSTRAARRRASHVDRADNGRKPKNGKESKSKRRWRLFRHEKDGQKDLDHQQDHLFINKEGKRKKEIRKKSRHPEMGLFPKGVH